MNSTGEGMGLRGVALDHYRAPRNANGLKSSGDRVGRGCAGAVQSGVEAAFQVVASNDGRLAELRWECMGPPAAIAAASWLSEELRGVTPADAGSWTALAIGEVLHLPVESMSSVLVVEDALRAALADLEQHQRSGGSGS